MTFFIFIFCLAIFILFLYIVSAEISYWWTCVCQWLGKIWLQCCSKFWQKTHKIVFLLHTIVILALNKAEKEIQTHTDMIRNIWMITRILDRRKDSVLQMSLSVLAVLFYLTCLDPQQMPKIPEHTFIVVVYVEHLSTQLWVQWKYTWTEDKTCT